MKKIKTKKKNLFLIATFLIIISLVLSYFRHTYDRKNVLPQSRRTDSNDNGGTKSVAGLINQAKQDSASASTVAPPKQPILSMSSGNNGPIPSGVPVNFICSDDAPLKCTIILQNDITREKKSLGPTTIADNGKGENFASFYWTSGKGKYTVSAQVTNNQGTTNSSINQSLEVQ